MTSWPLLQRNKVDDSKVTTPVMLCAESENETVKTLAKKVRLYLECYHVLIFMHVRSCWIIGILCHLHTGYQNVQSRYVVFSPLAAPFTAEA